MPVSGGVAVGSDEIRAEIAPFLALRGTLMVKTAKVVVRGQRSVGRWRLSAQPIPQHMHEQDVGKPVHDCLRAVAGIAKLGEQQAERRAALGRGSLAGDRNEWRQIPQNRSSEALFKQVPTTYDDGFRAVAAGNDVAVARMRGQDGDGLHTGRRSGRVGASVCPAPFVTRTTSRSASGIGAEPSSGSSQQWPRSTM